MAPTSHLLAPEPPDTATPLGAELPAFGMETYLARHRNHNLNRIAKETSAEEAPRFIAGGLVEAKRFAYPELGP